MSRRNVLPEIKAQSKSSASLNSNSSKNDDLETRKLQLIKLANSTWGANLWSYSVTNQQLDFTDYQNGNYTVGVASFVKVQLSNGIFREDMGYATMEANQRGLAIYQARKCSITNALSEIFTGFGLDIQEIISKDTVSISVPNLNDNNASLSRASSPAGPRKQKITKTDRSADVSSPIFSQLDEAIADIPEIVMKEPEIIKSSRPQKPKENIPLKINVENQKPEPLAPILPTKNVTKSVINSSSKILEDSSSVNNSTAKVAELYKDFKNMTESEIKAERLRRQRLKQEEFKKSIQQNIF